MDVRSLYRVILITSLLLLAACDKDAGDSVFQKSASCEEQEIKGEYLVEWIDGTVTVVKHDSEAELFKETIEPHREKIRVVNPNLRMIVQPYETMNSSNTQVNNLNGNTGPTFRNWGRQAINAAYAWEQGYTGQGITVAVIDSGVAIDHPLIAPRLIANPGEKGTDSFGQDKSSNGIDDDGNGYIDDIHGYNFAARIPNNIDNNGHGTHVAGIAAADHDDIAYSTSLPQGVAPGASILPLDFIEETSGGTLDAAVEAMEYVRNMSELMNIRVVNASWGGPACSSILENKIAELGARNILFVAAAGNSGNNIDIPSLQEFPAAYIQPNQITVGSTTFFGGMASHSNFGAITVDIFAPGEDIFSTVFSNGVGNLTGTSMAAPFVAGAAAALWSAKPTADYQEIKQALYNGVDSDSQMISQARGSLNLQRSLQVLLGTSINSAP
tara:strand:- start:190631 stop:191953 length:1323 start_codon:yes stop_codon:yes gene_type:complete